MHSPSRKVSGKRWKDFFCLTKILLVTFAFLGIAGCSIFAPVQVIQPRTYLLNPTPCSQISSSPTNLTLLVITPQATRAYNTTQMLYIACPHELASFTKNAWADSPSQMLLPLIIQSLQNSCHFHAVVIPPFYENYDLVLRTQLIQLQQEFLCHPSRVRLVMRAQLVNFATQKVIACRQFCILVQTPCDTPYGGVLAANQAVAKFLNQLTEFCIVNSS